MARTPRESLFSTTRRLVRTVAKLHPAQVAMRPVHVARTALLGNVPWLAEAVAGETAPAPGPALVALEGPLDASLIGVAEELARASAALAGEVMIVGRRIPIRPPETDFIAPEDPKLVRYQVNYLGIVRSLAVAANVSDYAQQQEARHLALAHLDEFVRRVPPGHADAWEPYVVAMRLLNLTLARDLLRPDADGGAREFLDGPILRALAQHARWLSTTLELHLLGNHLFTNGAALYVAGCLLDTPGAVLWRALGEAILTRSIITDLLDDGGHAERSPMYQALYLDQLSLVLAAARASGRQPPAGATSAAERLATQLAAIRHPDGDIPLFGDSALSEAPLPMDLGAPFHLAEDSLRRRLFGELGRALPITEGCASFPETGLLALREGEHLLVVDAGPLGTPDQPGHAHADALTFEWSHAGRRFIVDAGAGHYETDAHREYFRGPFAHSGVSVNGQGTDELWASFRAGARARIDRLRHDRAGAFHVVRGRLRAAGGWRAERLLLFVPGHLVAVFDRFDGVTGSDRPMSHLLFAPDVTIEPSGEAFAVRDGGGASFTWHRLLGGAPEWHRGQEHPPRGLVALHLGRFQPAHAMALPASVHAGTVGAAHALVGPQVRLSETERGWRLSAERSVVEVGLDRGGLRWEQRG